MGFINTQFYIQWESRCSRIRKTSRPSRRGQFSLINRGIRKLWEDIILEQTGASKGRLNLIVVHNVVLR